MTDGPATTIALRVVDVAKAYGETVALCSCTLEVKCGEVHAIMGENGSGKSTLIKVLSGVATPDRGYVSVLDKPPVPIRTPRIARSLGIATVFQEILIARNLSVLDNVYMGQDGLFRRGSPAKGRRRDAEAMFARLLPEPPDLDGSAAALSLGQQQVCAIVRALLQRRPVLLLDESTSALDIVTRERLFSLMRDLCAQGGAVVFISHRLDEVQRVADRVTVLRSGVSVATLDKAEASPAEMLRLMSNIGAEAVALRGTAADRPGTVAMAVDNVTLRQGAPGVSCAIRRGEILGLAGLEGHGQDDFLAVLSGHRRPIQGSVIRIMEDGQRRQVKRAPEASRMGIAYVPRERQAEGLFPTLSILDNFAMASLRSDGRFGVLSPANGRRRLERYISMLAIKAPRPSERITTLSGGTQQKIIMARWLATQPQILLLNDPTRGVDHATKQDIYRELADLAAKGLAIVMLSTELDELIALMDRVLVFREGAVFEELTRMELTRSRLVASLFGHGHHA